MKTQLFKTVIAAVFILTACTKNENPVQKEVLNKNTITTASIDSGPANPQNPFDSIGLRHNEGCAYVISRMQQSREKGIDSYKLYTDQYLQNRLNRKPVIDQSIVSKIQRDSVGLYKRFIDNLPVSAAAKNYLRMLYTSLPLSKNEAGRFSFSDYKSRVLEVESLIGTDNSLNDQERNLVYKAASVARYSAWLWSEGGATYRLPRLLKTLLQVTATVAADISGLCGGDNYYSYMSDGEIWGPVLTSSFTYGMIGLYVP